MLYDTIKEISTAFIAEAKNSPNLLADLAALEKYVAESYNGRVLIELLQNADDCGSSRVMFFESNGDLFFANDGRPFTEADVLSICRSGASNKERGTNIGYRGIGFKSTTYLTDEIIIYSSQTYFSFSKKMCSNILDIREENTPLVRIPMLIDNVDYDTKSIINKLSSDGYTTVFVFKHANLEAFVNEVDEANNSLFIFLHSITECSIDINQIKKFFKLRRINKDIGTLITFSDNSQFGWYIVPSTSASIAFKYDLSSNTIIECSEDERLFHSFLPTFDKTPYPIKVNADFSTDPSRKHISADQETKQAIDDVASLIFELITDTFNEKLTKEFCNILLLFGSSSSFSKINIMLKKRISNLVIDKCKLMLNSGKQVSITEYKLLPDWIDESEKMGFRKNSDFVKDNSISFSIYNVFNGVDLYIKNYSDNHFSDEEIASIMAEPSIGSDMTPETQGKIIGKLIKSEVFKRTVKKESNERIGEISISTKSGRKRIRDISSPSHIDKRLYDVIITNSGVSEFQQFFGIADPNKETPEVTNTVVFERAPADIKPHISKWRSAEQQCIEIERFFGNTPVDVSKANKGYDIESTTPEGMIRYIEVKSVSNKDSFSITNNEYTAAHQHGDQYYLCVMVQNERKLEIIYIRNPLKKLHFEKRIRQWEWFCDSYTGERYTFEY